jgi:hypothetical protein
MADPIVTPDKAQVSMQPGGQAQVVAKISRNSTIVEGFDLTILGAGGTEWHLRVRPDGHLPGYF